MSLADYLKSLPASFDKKQWRSDKYNRESVNDALQGAGVYMDNCNACHGLNGAGANRIFPNLVGNEAVNAMVPASLVHIVLTGSSMPSTQTAPSAIAMPGFDWRLTDVQVGDVLTFIRTSWGNHAFPIGKDDVCRLRKALATQKLVEKQNK
jgi:mono/diheme cytochrome c family protein